MQLRTARIENYRAIDELELSFLDSRGRVRPMTVLAGPNGSGKTSILFAITNALRGPLGYRAEEVPEPDTDDIRLPSASRTAWAKSIPEIRVSLELQFDEQEQEAIPELLRIVGMEPPPPLPDGILKVHWVFPPKTQPDGLRDQWWMVSLEPPFHHVRSWLSARRLAIKAWRVKQPGMYPELLDSIGGLFFFPQDRNLMQRVLGRGIESGVRDVDSSVQDDEGERESRLSPGHQRPVLPVTDILRYISDYARGRVQAIPDEKNWEKRIQETFHKVCYPKEYLGYLYREDDPLGAPILQNNGYQYPLSQAASGEQVILEYITRLTYPRPFEHSLILIDEPEVHLHPAWTRQLYLALSELSQTNQFVMCTHSMELRRRAAEDNALIELQELEIEA